MLLLYTSLLLLLQSNADKDVEPFEVENAGLVVTEEKTRASPELYVPSLQLHHAGVMVMLEAAVIRAEEIGVPQCIVIVDASGEPLGEIRMTNSKFLSRRSAAAKARTAASTNNLSHKVDESVAARLAAATQGGITNLMGGIPIRIDGTLVGGIGVGSGHGQQDLEVARAALAAAGADYVT